MFDSRAELLYVHNTYHQGKRKSIEKVTQSVNGRVADPGIRFIHVLLYNWMHVLERVLCYEWKIIINDGLSELVVLELMNYTDK